MNPLDLTPGQLKRAAAIKEQLDRLNKELRNILGGSAIPASAAPKERTRSAAAKKRIAATQRARWAKLRRAKSATSSTRPAAKAKKKPIGSAARAKLSAKLKAYWAAKKSGKK